MKKFEITYKNVCIMFGDSVFTKIMEGETAEKALNEYAFKNNFVLKMISAKEVN